MEILESSDEHAGWENSDVLRWCSSGWFSYIGSFYAYRRGR